MKKFFLMAFAAMCFSGCNSAEVDNSTVGSIDMNRYLGYWYEIAKFDHNFERGLEYAMAHYSLRDDGKIDVLVLKTVVQRMLRALLKPPQYQAC